MRSIFTYLNYREYLGDYYAEKKESSSFTYRKYARMCGFASPVFLKLVINGKSNLSKPASRKLSLAFGFSRPEADYFEKLVLFCQEKNIQRKLTLLDDLLRLSRSLKIEDVAADQYEYFNKWYYSVIRELVSLAPPGDAAANIASLIHPPLTAGEAGEAIALLKRLNIVRDRGDGRLEATGEFLSSGSRIPVEIVRNYQRQMALLVSDALDGIAPPEREISGATVSVSRGGFEKIRDELNRCRRRILEIASEDRDIDRVYRVNLHAFPVSRPAQPSEERQERG
jgi:uncharacterized protein (TIGR02147 family)